MDDTIQIPGYIIERNVGNGAMASVYLAMHQNLERRVALKLMAGSLVTDETFRERFLKEGKIVAQLNHPNIITIYDIGVVQSNYFMAMEYVSGGTLKERMAKGLSPGEAVEILVALAKALGYAHKRSFIHRDVKPANILFREDGTPVLSDFGIAKTLGAGTQMTRTGWAVGTPSYMSPEQALGKTVDARCDLYSLGVMFFEMLSGEKPFKANDSFAIALMHVNDPVPRLSGELSEFQPVIDTLMAKSPDDRFPDADSLIEALRPFRQEQTDAAAATATASGKKKTTARAGSRQTGSRQTGVRQDGSGAAAGRWPLWAGAGVVALGLAGYFGYTQLLPETPREPIIANVVDPFGLENPVERTLTEAQRVQVGQLLEMAELNLEIGRLVDPPVSNAAHGFREVLKLDPSNEIAREGLQQIAGHFLERTRNGLSQGDPPSTLRGLVEAGLVAMPQHPELLELKQELDQRLSQR